MTSSQPDAADAPVDLPGYAHVYSGKVRDLYAPLDASGEARDDQLLLVASDRLSAFDFILETPIPDKGAVLTQLSLWWFEQLEDLVPNHVVSTDVPTEVAGRAVLVRRLEMLPVECVARAYLTGGGLREYVADGHVSGVLLPEGLVDGSRLPEPVFTPSTKAPVGEHDQPMTYAAVVAAVGERTAQRAERPHHRGSWLVATRSRPSGASSSPTPRSSSGSRATSWCWPTRCSPRTRRGSGRPTSGSPATPSRPSTRSSCASG